MLRTPANGREFYVMYGQTEAAPRISYLPPEYAEDNPDCIGVAVPGGNLSLVDDDNLPILEAGLAGELVYKGPNIMVGYALQPDDLATKEVIAKLYTGDIAIMKANGLFKIVGRKARFVKPFGLRLNLDDIEIYLNDSLKTGPFYLSGTDQKIVVFYVSKDVNEHNLLNNLSEYYSLPTTLFKLQRLDDIPLMANGKVNYKVLQNYGVAQASGFTSIVSFLGQFLIGSIREFFAIMLDFSDQWQSVEEIFRIQFPRADIRAEDSFISLGGDSLKHIEVSLCLEDYLGDLPDDWHDMSVKDLQSLKNGKHV